MPMIKQEDYEQLQTDLAEAKKNGAVWREACGLNEKQIERLRKAMSDSIKFKGVSVFQCLTEHPKAREWIENCPDDDKAEYPDTFSQYLIEQALKENNK